MVRPRDEVIAEISRHTEKLFKFLDILATKRERSMDFIQKELGAHKTKVIEAIERNLIQPKSV